MNPKRWLLLLSIIVLLALAVLASSLHDVKFQPARTLPHRPFFFVPLLPFPADEIASVPLWKIILIWATFFIAIVLFIYLLPPEIRKRLIRQFISFALGILMLVIAFHFRLIELPKFNFGPSQSDQAGSGTNSSLDVPVFQPPAVTPWMTYLISFGILFALLFVTWLIYRWWTRERIPSSSLEEIARIAQSSLDDLASGRDWDDVIIQSYIQMGEAVNAKRGLRRAEAMTPREFADRLEHAGLPADAVKRLTRLFESVRYGARKSSQSDIDDAVACLNSILRACGAAT